MRAGASFVARGRFQDQEWPPFCSTLPRRQPAAAGGLSTYQKQTKFLSSQMAALSSAKGDSEGNTALQKSKLLFLFLFLLCLLLDSWPLLKSATVISPKLLRPLGVGSLEVTAPPLSPAMAALHACHTARGRGPAHYFALARVVPGARVVDARETERGARLHGDRGCGTEVRDGRPVTHCCTMEIQFQGRTGNQATQSMAGRYFAEMNSCAARPVEIGGLGWVAAGPAEALWPPADGFFTDEDAATVAYVSDAFYFFSFPESRAVGLRMFPEHPNFQLSALSLGWDLAGDTLIGSGVRGLNGFIMNASNVAERCGRWAVHREACARAGGLLLTDALQNATPAAAAGAAGKDAAAGLLDEAVSATLEGLHPWLPSAVRKEAEALLRGKNPLLRVLVEAPERTMVVHLRLGDKRKSSLADALVRGKLGIRRRPGFGLLAGAPAEPWLGEAFLDRWDLLEGAPYPPGVDPTTAEIESLEGNAARSSTYTVPPLSFFRTVLGATRSAWDALFVVGEPDMDSSSLAAALRAEFNATLLSGSSVVTDFAVLALARQLVLSGSSTFAIAAASLGRARVVHLPLSSSSGVRNTEGFCAVPPGAFDARWVFHDIYRAAVRRVAEGFAAQAAAARAAGLRRNGTVTRAWAAEASRGVWGAHHLEWLAQPLAYAPPSEEDCPGDAAGFGARGLSRALGARGPEPPRVPPGAPTPLFFLTYEEVKDYYRKPACVRFFFPDLAAGEWADPPRTVWNTCTDNAPISPLNEDGVQGRGCRIRGAWLQPCEVCPQGPGTVSGCPLSRDALINTVARPPD
jgi:hypothetical protein